MSHDRRTDRRALAALAALLPAGTLGLSVSLAAASAKATTTEDPAARKPGSVAERLNSIREGVTGAIDQRRFLKVDTEQRLAWWGNWHNGWPNWHNWGNGWGNGGWHNWGNGWHNWGNGWHNW